MPTTMGQVSRREDRGADLLRVSGLKGRRCALGSMYRPVELLAAADGDAQPSGEAYTGAAAARRRRI